MNATVITLESFSTARLSFGFKTPQQYSDYRSLFRVWRAADAQPAYEHGWLFDHFTPSGSTEPGSCLEAWSTLSALAVSTSRLRLGVMVSSVTHRHPSMLGHMLATLDHLSDGRAEFGFGAGWDAHEHRRWGIDMPPPAVRLAQWNEACEVVKLLCTGETVSYRGAHYRLDGARLDPSPRVRPRFILGAWGDRALHVVARHADVWDIVESRLAGFAAKKAVLAAHCERIGRDPSEITLSTQLHVDTRDLGVTRDWARRFVRAGVRRLIFVLPPPFSPHVLDDLAQQIIAPLRLLES